MSDGSATSRRRRMEHRLYGAALDSRAVDAANKPLAQWDLQVLGSHRYCLLVTYRRDGSAVATPVWLAVLGDALCARTDARSGKIKRIRNDDRVRVAPCTARGRPTGPPMPGAARLLEGRDALEAEQALLERYGLHRRIYGYLLSSAENAAYIQISPRESS